MRRFFFLVFRVALLLLLQSPIRALADDSFRPPPPKAAPPPTPPERRTQLITRSTGVACSAVAATVTLRRINLRSPIGKVVLVVALAASYLGGAQTAGWIADLVPEAPIPAAFPQEPYQKQSYSSSQDPYHADIEVEDVEREEIKRHRKTTLQEQLFFWRKSKSAPVPSDDTPPVPEWSNAYQKKQNYEENYGI
ncbi:expressed unknown protein [Seminavis robusta]|uniref:Transmembrane protein n=1 Tax=Seminavis robusta TaxID=568900 RepID=A0A9N8E0Q3_9STRA|nr:expressed unknown protein [Seminavis robusta]|eukprot:Sro533_g161570.1 n/a (194) ;mRNA; r:10306-10887